MTVLSKQIAKHFREVHFGGNWTSVNLKETLAGVTWQQATAKYYSMNTIATLVFHINYYISAVMKVLQGEPLNAHDKYSFDLLPILSEQDWEKLLEKTWADANTFANMIEQMPDSKLQETMADEKYGNWYLNLHGIIEHTHYHLGQIVLIKKIAALVDENFGE
ncbi:MAG: DinB family protein [Fimbriimonadaceae bacterium]|nr:DinB family protein [Chitinophagales bacterium]